MNRDKLIDLSYLLKASDDKSFLLKMFDIFKTLVPEIRLQMYVALSKNDFNSIFSLAHKLKSPISILGMANTKLKIQELENDAKAGLVLSNYQERIDEIFNDCQLAINEIQIFEKTL